MTPSPPQNGYARKIGSTGAGSAISRPLFSIVHPPPDRTQSDSPALSPQQRLVSDRGSIGARLLRLNRHSCASAFRQMAAPLGNLCTAAVRLKVSPDGSHYPKARIFVGTESDAVPAWARDVRDPSSRHGRLTLPELSVSCSSEDLAVGADCVKPIGFDDILPLFACASFCSANFSNASYAPPGNWKECVR